MFGLAFAFSILIYGCSSSPSPSDAEKALSQQIDSESGGQIKLVSFKKTDGQMSVVNAVKHYELDYEADIEFEADGIWLGKDILNHSHGGLTFSFHPGQSSGNSFEQLNNSIAGGVAVHRGDHIKIAGVMNGEKKESGWKFETEDSHLVSGPTASSSPEKSAQEQAVNGQQQVDNSKLQPDLEKQKPNGQKFPPVPAPTKNARLNVWGYINQSGAFVIQPQYAKADYFSQGLAKVELLPDKNDPEKKPPKGFIDPWPCLGSVDYCGAHKTWMF